MYNVIVEKMKKKRTSEKNSYKQRQTFLRLASLSRALSLSSLLSHTKRQIDKESERESEREIISVSILASTFLIDCTDLQSCNLLFLLLVLLVLNGLMDGCMNWAVLGGVWRLYNVKDFNRQPFTHHTHWQVRKYTRTYFCEPCFLTPQNEIRKNTWSISNSIKKIYEMIQICNRSECKRIEKWTEIYGFGAY